MFGRDRRLTTPWPAVCPLMEIHCMHTRLRSPYQYIYALLCSSCQYVYTVVFFMSCRCEIWNNGIPLTAELVGHESMVLDKKCTMPVTASKDATMPCSLSSDRNTLYNTYMHCSALHINICPIDMFFMSCRCEISDDGISLTS